MLALNAICCPCIVYSTNRDKLQHLTAHGEREPSHAISSRLSPPQTDCPLSALANPAPQRVGLWCCLYALAPQATFGIGQVSYCRSLPKRTTSPDATRLSSQVVLQCFSRLQTRQRFSIRGDIVQDALIGTACSPLPHLRVASADRLENQRHSAPRAPSSRRPARLTTRRTR